MSAYQQKMWAIKMPNGALSHFMWRRKSAVGSFIRCMGAGTWKDWYRRGHRAVKVTITEQV